MEEDMAKLLCMQTYLGNKVSFNNQQYESYFNMTVHTPLPKTILSTATDTSFDNTDNTGFQRGTNLPPLADA